MHPDHDAPEFHLSRCGPLGPAPKRLTRDERRRLETALRAIEEQFKTGEEQFKTGK